MNRTHAITFAGGLASGRGLPQSKALSGANTVRTIRVFTSAATILFAWVADAADKSQYNLFNPTPRELMRELSADRPDKTESAYTVDAGHYQIEMDVFNYTVDRNNGVPGDHRSEALAIAPINIKAGLLNNVDLQLMVVPYLSLREHNVAAGTVDEHRGFGDLTPRIKINLWGNDGGPTALALMPFVKLPTNTDHLGNHSVEGGLIVPLAVSLPYDWSMGFMTRLDINRDESGDGYHPEFVNSITFSHSIVGQLSGYLEFFSAVSTESDSEWVGTVDTGLTYTLSEDIQLDAGVNVGVTRSADDVNPFLGITWRF